MGEFDTEEGATQVRAFPFVGGDRILVADADDDRRGWLRAAIGGTYPVEETDNARDALARLTGDPPKIFVVGTALVDVTGEQLIAYCVRHGMLGAHQGGAVVFLLSDSVETAPHVDEQAVSVFFRLTPALPAERLRELVTQALARGTRRTMQRPSTEDDATRTRQILEHIKALSVQTDARGAALAAVAAVKDVARADGARCLYYDDEQGTLWSEVDGNGDEAPASVGIAGYVARAAMPVLLAHAAGDAAYHPEVDDPGGTGDERLIVQPVIDRERRVHAVLIAIRAATSPEFSTIDAGAVGEIAASWAPYIHQLAATAEAQGDHSPGEDVFRQEAIQHLIRRGNRGDVVRIHPAWINGAFWLVLAAVGALVGFAAIARIHQYSEGAGVVRVTGRTDLIAYDGGSVTAIEVTPGQHVAENQVLVRLHDTEQANKMRGLDAEFERKLVAYLQTPADPTVRTALSALVAERESARASVDARVIRAPHDGTVREVLVTIGQRIEPGKVVASVAKKDVPEGLAVLAFVPGSDRPRLHLGQLVRLTLPGYRGAEVESRVRAISSDAIGAADARSRYLGDRLGDSVPIQGSVVVVEAELPKTFESDGHVYELHDGMVGNCEVRLESKTVLETTIQGLGR